MPVFSEIWALSTGFFRHFVRQCSDRVHQALAWKPDLRYFYGSSKVSRCADTKNRRAGRLPRILDRGDGDFPTHAEPFGGARYMRHSGFPRGPGGRFEQTGARTLAPVGNGTFGVAILPLHRLLGDANGSLPGRRPDRVAFHLALVHRFRHRRIVECHQRHRWFQRSRCRSGDYHWPRPSVLRPSW